jgi:hypothetical protein
MTDNHPNAWPHPVHLSGANPELHYRRLERDYRGSAQYAAMVERYPQLKASIEQCSQGDLIHDGTGLLPPQAAGVQLEWERSHGES